METVRLDMKLFNTQTKKSFKEIMERLGWQIEEKGDEFIVTYPTNEEVLFDFLIDSMI